MALAGFMITRLIKDADDLFVAGRELTPFILCATITATNLSMFHFIGMGGTAYKNGISIIWQNWAGDMALVISGIFVIPLMRRLRLRSVPEFLQMRYGKGLRVLVGAFWGIRLCAFLGILLYLAATAAGIITGYNNYYVWLIAFSVVSILYSVIGGAWAVAIMDSVQFLFMLGAGLIIFPVAIHAAGGLPHIINWLKTNGHENSTRLIPTAGEFNWIFILAMSGLSLKWATIDQAILQRAFGARTPRMGAQGMVLAGIITTPFAFYYLLPGLATAQLHPGFEKADAAIPWLLSTHIPQVGKGLLGLVLCGLVAAQISTITADVNSVATLFTSDVYRVIRSDRAGQRELMWVVRVCSILCGALMLAMALLLQKTGEGAVQANLVIVGILDMPLFVVTVVYGLLWRRANWQGATAGFLVGGVVGVMCYLLIDPKYWNGYLHPLVSHISDSLDATMGGWHQWLSQYKTNLRSIAPIASASTALIITPLVSMITRAPEYDRALYDRFHAHGKDAREAAVLAGENEDEDDFHLVPRSVAGKIGLFGVVAGYVTYISGVLCASGAPGIAPVLAVAGMLVVFVGGVMRVYSR
jgi:SSS family solute:Na+ symporter